LKTNTSSKDNLEKLFCRRRKRQQPLSEDICDFETLRRLDESSFFPLSENIRLFENLAERDWRDEQKRVSAKTQGEFSVENYLCFQKMNVRTTLIHHNNQYVRVIIIAMKPKKIDKPFLLSVVLLIVAGALIFTSAAFGIVARDNLNFSNVLLKQAIFGLGLGGLCMYIISRLPYKWIKRSSILFFVIALILNALVFVPGIGFKHGGASRWLSFAGFTIQPSEFLKIAMIIYYAAWASSLKDRIKTFWGGFGPLAVVVGLSGALFLMQPDTDTFIIGTVAVLAIFIAAGGRFLHLAGIGILGAILGLGLIISRPYVKDRVMTFINPARDPQGSSYQIQQSLIAVGSGEMFGRGYGKSIQKFGFLPEPMGDSIYAVAAEEFGFVGSVALIVLYLFFTLSGFRVATKAPDTFGGLLVVGIVILIVFQSFFNIGAMLGVMPLSGNPLIFVSQGGTSLLFALAEVGLIFNISKHRKVK
jgi:cell division protein FtsW